MLIVFSFTAYHVHTLFFSLFFVWCLFVFLQSMINLSCDLTDFSFIALIVFLVIAYFFFQNIEVAFKNVNCTLYLLPLHSILSDRYNIIIFCVYGYIYCFILFVQFNKFSVHRTSTVSLLPFNCYHGTC